MGQMMEWKSVEEDGVPKSGEFIVYDAMYEEVSVGYLSSWDDEYVFETYANKDGCDVTHYMKLPSKPNTI